MYFSLLQIEQLETCIGILKTQFGDCSIRVATVFDCFIDTSFTLAIVYTGIHVKVWPMKLDQL